MAPIHRPVLGEVITVGDDSWMVVSRRYDHASTRDIAVAARIPDGDTAAGLGHTWHAQNVQCRTIVTEPSPRGAH
jgi:hypothetical protein